MDRIYRKLNKVLWVDLEFVFLKKFFTPLGGKKLVVIIKTNFVVMNYDEFDPYITVYPWVRSSNFQNMNVVEFYILYQNLGPKGGFCWKYVKSIWILKKFSIHISSSTFWYCLRVWSGSFHFKFEMKIFQKGSVTAFWRSFTDEMSPCIHLRGSSGFS